MQNYNWLIALIYIAFGLYLINFSFAFYPLPAFFSGIEKIVLGIAGILLVIGSFKFFRRYPRYP